MIEEKANIVSQVDLQAGYYSASLQAGFIDKGGAVLRSFSVVQDNWEFCVFASHEEAKTSKGEYVQRVIPRPILKGGTTVYKEF